MNCILLLVSLAMGVGKNIISKAGGAAFSRTDMLLKNNIAASAAALAFAVAAAVTGAGNIDFKLMLNFPLFAISLLLGIFIMLSQMFYIYALKNEKVSVCSLIYSCGFIIPTISGAALYHESVSVPDVIGIISVLFSVYLTAGIKGIKLSRSLYPAVSAMISSGMVGVLQKIYAHKFYDKTNEGLFIAFSAMLIISLLLLTLLYVREKSFAKRKHKPAYEKANTKTVCLMTLFAVCVAGTNKLNLILSGSLPSVIFFPVINGGCIAATAITGMLVFKEKLSGKQICGIILNICSIILISM